MVHAVRSAAPPPGAVRATGRRAPRRVVARLALVLGSLALVLPTTHAASAPRTLAAADEPTVTFGLTPTQPNKNSFRANFELAVTPGQEVKDSVRIRNLSGNQITLDVYATDALNSESGAVDLLAGADRPKDIGSWITLERSSVTLASQDFIDVGFTLRVPADASPGDHTAGILASYTGDAVTSNGPSMMIDRRIGTRVLARVAGALTPKLVVSDLKTTWEGTVNPLGRGTMTVSYRVANAGNVRMGANQKIKIASPFGMPAKTFSPAQIPDLMPGNSVLQTHKISGVWPTFRSSTKVTVSPVAVREGDSFPADLTASAKTGNVTIPWAFLVMLAILFPAYRIWKRRQQQLQDLNAAELEAIVDARLGRPAGDAAVPNGHAPNGHSSYVAPSTDASGVSTSGGRPTP